MAKKELRFRLTVTFVTITLILASVFAASTPIGNLVAILAVFALMYAAAINIIYYDMQMFIIDLILIAVYMMIFAIELIF